MLSVILTSDHDDTDASSPAQLDGAHNFLTRRVEHANTAHEGQVSLEKRRKSPMRDCMFVQYHTHMSFISAYMFLYQSPTS